MEIIKSSSRLESVKEEISSLQKEKTDLEASINYKKSDGYIEKTARNELSMIKPGETVYVVKGAAQQQSVPQLDNDVLSLSTQRQLRPRNIEDRVKTLKLWWRTIF